VTKGALLLYYHPLLVGSWLFAIQLMGCAAESTVSLLLLNLRIRLSQNTHKQYAEPHNIWTRYRDHRADIDSDTAHCTAATGYAWGLLSNAETSTNVKPHALRHARLSDGCSSIADLLHRQPG
jgi:hypothetical protein